MKKLTAIAALLCTLSLTVCDADAAKKSKEQAPLTEDQKTLAAFASSIGVAVPEPASMTLMLAMGAAMLATRRRRR
jgi:hypothetical protein